MSAQRACEAVIDLITRRIGSNTAGLIAVDRFGGYGWAFNTAGMGRAIMTEGMDQPISAIFPSEFFPKCT